MKQWIIEHFPKTADALVVDKHFGSALDETSANGRLHALALVGKEKEILTSAQEMEENEQKKKNK